MDLTQNGRDIYLFSDREVFAIFHAWLIHETVIWVRETKLWQHISVIIQYVQTPEISLGVVGIMLNEGWQHW